MEGITLKPEQEDRQRDGDRQDAPDHHADHLPQSTACSLRARSRRHDPTGGDRGGQGCRQRPDVDRFAVGFVDPLRVSVVGVRDSRIDNLRFTNERAESDRLRRHIIAYRRDDVTPLFRSLLSAGVEFLLGQRICPGRPDGLLVWNLLGKRTDQTLLRWADRRPDIARRRDTRLAGADLHPRGVGNSRRLGIVFGSGHGKRVGAEIDGNIEVGRSIEPAFRHTIDTGTLLFGGLSVADRRVIDPEFEAIGIRGLDAFPSLRRRPVDRGVIPGRRVRSDVIPIGHRSVVLESHRPLQPLVIGDPHGGDAASRVGPHATKTTGSIAFIPPLTLASVPPGPRLNRPGLEHSMPLGKGPVEVTKATFPSRGPVRSGTTDSPPATAPRQAAPWPRKRAARDRSIARACEPAPGAIPEAGRTVQR